MDMLHEDHSLSEASQWKKVKGSFERDPRYRAVPGSSQREEWFKEHIKSLGSKVRGQEGDGRGKEGEGRGKEGDGRGKQMKLGMIAERKCGME